MLKEKCLIIAGEKSGEEHAMSFLPTILKMNPELEFFGVGGDEMKDCGVHLDFHLKEFSSWGFSEVIHKIPFYFKALNYLVEKAVRENAKFAILIDFQDFNLRLAKRLNKRGIKVFYYVAPQAWAWKAWRAKALSECVHTLFTIIPFEKKWFKERGVNQVKSVPHPLYFHYQEKLKNIKNDLGLVAKPFSNLQKGTKILLLPGSRNFEVKGLLPIFVEAIANLDDCEIGIVRSPNVNPLQYTSYEQNFDREWSHQDIDKALAWADCALAASGTVTLTCALFEVPTIVCYNTSFLNEYIFHTFLNYDWFISLANIVHNEEVYPELVQEYATAYNINSELKKLRNNPEYYERIKGKLGQTCDLLTGELENVGEFIASEMKEIILKSES